MRERRRVTRMPPTDLPEILKIFYIEVGNAKDVRAETLDASTEGIGFSVPLSTKNIKKGDHIIMRSGDERFEFTGTVVHVTGINMEKNHIGIKFV